MSTNLAPYATNPMHSKGRLHVESQPTLKFQNEFQRDLTKVINCASFRRLEYKTQVFINGKGDHYRTRLTHSLEVAQVGKIIANALDLCSDLTEVLCLAHDVGHPPFGHAGEKVLNRMLKNHGGFNHNIYVLKLLTHLEDKYIKFNGINLTWETLEGIIKHNGPLTDKSNLGYIAEYNEIHDLALDKFPSLEAQVASLADDIAYTSHDLEDGLKANLFSLEDLRKANIINDIINEVEDIKKKVDAEKVIYEITIRLANQCIEDLISYSAANIRKFKIIDLHDVQNAGTQLISFSRNTDSTIKKLKAFLFKNMYKNKEVLQMLEKSERIIEDLYNLYLQNPKSLPMKWYNKIDKDQKNLHVTIVDYIAGMTDPFAVKAHKFFYNH